MRRRGIGVLAALCAALTVTLAGAGEAGARVPREFFGLVPQDRITPTADVERMGQGKVGTVRLLISWPAVEPADDNFKWGPIDAYVTDLAAQGIRPFPFVFGSAPFVSSNPIQMPVQSAKAKAEWKEFLGEAADRYGPGGPFARGQLPGQAGGANPIRTWQLWNEQNAPKHVLNPSPAGYGELVKITDEAITREDPGAQLVLGGMFGRPTGTAVTGPTAAGKGGAIKAWKFLKRLYKTEGVKESFDGVALHPYSPNIKGIKEQIGKFRKVLKKKKDKGTDIWVTELGWGSTKKGRLGVGKKKQGKLLKQSFKLLKKKRGKWHIGGVMWYTWRDLGGGNAPCDWCATAGLFEPTGDNPKRAWKKYVRFTGGS
jgi:hypothetical protein